MTPILKKILVVRNDKLGDFMLTYPAFALLKNTLPDTKIYALVQRYTEPMAKLCPHIDEVIVDPHFDTGANSNKHNIFQFISALKQHNFDAVIVLYSTTRIAVASWLAGIPCRLAPATKFAQLFYTNRLKQRRSLSQKPEYLYNQELAEFFLQLKNIPLGSHGTPPYLTFDKQLIVNLKQQFCIEHAIPAENKLIFIHPGSGGSANNLSLDQYAELASQLTTKQPFTIVISAGPAESEAAQNLATQLQDVPHVVYISEQGLLQFAQHLAFADVFISGSTGPLHIAGALDRPTAAFYTRRRSATALRWQTLNSETKRLAFSPPQSAEAEDMRSINITEAAQNISEKYLLN